MSSTGSFSQALTKMDWDSILRHPEWSGIPDEWHKWQTQNPAQALNDGEHVLLFRTHKYHNNPDLRQKEGDKIVHASCKLVIPGSLRIREYDAAGIYGCATRFAFVTLYEARKDQKFFPDEGLELSLSSELEGTAITSIEKFDPEGCHFETNARNCKQIGLYMILLPEDNSNRIKPPPVNTDAIKVLRLDDKPEILKQLNTRLESLPPAERREKSIKQPAADLIL